MLAKHQLSKQAPKQKSISQQIRLLGELQCYVLLVPKCSMTNTPHNKLKQPQGNRWCLLHSMSGSLPGTMLEQHANYLLTC